MRKQTSFVGKSMSVPTNRKLGFDIDDCLADFSGAMRALTARATTPREIEAIWVSAQADPVFWGSLKPLPGAVVLAETLHDIGSSTDLYFVTARQGSKQQTEAWLTTHLGLYYPTVLRTAQKGLAAKALGLTAFVDDKLEFALDVRLESPTTRVYLVDRPYNAYAPIDGIQRITSLSEMLDRELLLH